MKLPCFVMIATMLPALGLGAEPASSFSTAPTEFVLRGHRATRQLLASESLADGTTIEAPVETSSDTDPEARSLVLRPATSFSSMSGWSTAGIGSCQISSSVWTSGPS